MTQTNAHVHIHTMGSKQARNAVTGPAEAAVYHTERAHMYNEYGAAGPHASNRCTHPSTH